MSKRKEAKLRPSSLAKLAATSPAAIFKVDKGGSIVYADKKAEEILGLRESETADRIYDDPIWKITDFEGNELPDEKSPFRKVLDTREPISEVRGAIELPNGERKYLSVNASPLFEDGHFEGILAFIEDITDHQRTEKMKERLLRNLVERNKELHLLYEIANLSTDSDISLKDFLRQVVEKVPYAWQYPEITCARITYESEEFTTYDFRETSWSQTSPIEVDGRKVGAVEVYYLEEKPEANEGPFLQKERNLLDSFAKLLGQVISDEENKVKKDRLNSLLHSVREIDRTLVKSDEKDELIKEACEILAGNNGYEGSWIVLLDDSNHLLNSAQSGLKEDFNEILKQIEAGEMPTRLQKALDQPGTVLAKDPTGEDESPQISDSEDDQDLLIARLASEEGVYGAVSASKPAGFAEEERKVFTEMAENLGFGLRNIEVRNKLKKREDQLKKSQQIANVGSWRIDLKADELEWSEETYRIFGVSPEKEERFSSEDFLDFTHPEDKDRVFEEWEKAMGGGTFDLEHRIVVDGETKWVRGKAEVTFDPKGDPREVVGTVQDITGRKKTEIKLQESEKKFRSYVENAPLGVILADEEGNYLEVNEAACEMTGYSRDELLNMRLPDIHPPGVAEDIQKAFGKLLKSGERSADFPYLRKDGTEGHLLLSGVEIEENRFLGFALDITERKETERQLEKATIGVLQALNRTIEAKDEYTGEHIDRVQKFSLMIAEELGLPEERREQLRYASILHDVGKIGVSDAILGKPDTLTEEEWVQMEKHPKVGERIVSEVDRLKRAAKIIGQHQEKYDGTGYPRGLEGEEITLEARIIAVADAWDAMRTDRPYRDALSREEAIRELKENSGSQFDPEVVDVILEMIEEKEIEFSEKDEGGSQ